MTMATNNIFYNSDYIVIEYIDLIKCPYFMLLGQIKKNPKLKEILDMDEIETLDEAGLFEWYINRKHQNFLIDLNKYPDQIGKKELDDVLEEQMKITPLFYQYCPPLNLYHSLAALKAKKIVKDIIIFHPHQNMFAKSNLENETGLKFTFMSNLDKLLDITGANSTYFFSDIDKLEIMREKGILKFSSVTLPVEYRYNKKNMHEFKLDLNELYKKNTFKITFMNAISNPNS